MHRTTILLPVALRREAENVARAQGMTLSELIRRRLKAVVAAKGDSRRARDPLFRPGHLVGGKGLGDVARRHDDYLYGPHPKSGSGKAAR
ncbi:hypothetical protein BH20VER3_BH20VER3_07310 [soil metagenome]